MKKATRMALWFLLTLTPCRRRRDITTMGQKAAQPHPKVNVDEAALGSRTETAKRNESILRDVLF